MNRAAAAIGRLHTAEVTAGVLSDGGYGEKKTFEPVGVFRAGVDSKLAEYGADKRGVHECGRTVRIYLDKDTELVENAGFMIDGTVYRVRAAEYGELALVLELEEDKWI